MGLIFVPTSDYATTATQAATIQELDLGFVIAGSSASASFRLGNTGTTPVTVTLYIEDEDPYLSPAVISLSLAQMTLPANGFSDTLTVTIDLPIEAISSPATASLIAWGADGSSASLGLAWTAVGANTERSSQYPEYATGFSDNVTDAILRASEPLRIYRFDPVAYPDNPDPKWISFQTSPTGGKEITSWQNHSARLDPLNSEYGYTASVSTIRASFQAEDWEITTQYTRDNSTMTYTGNARLYIPAEYELDRQWALFNSARGVDRDQFKRTVYLTMRRSMVWVLQDVVPVFRGAELAYWRCNLIPVNDATMGTPGYYNPFALTYEVFTDRPYAMFSTRVEDIRPLLQELDN